MKFIFVEYGSVEYIKMLPITYIEETGGYKAPYGWICWAIHEIEGKKMAKMVWTRF